MSIVFVKAIPSEQLVRADAETEVLCRRRGCEFSQVLNYVQKN
jgi:hypothetical protein